jgi:hypothetical protein
MDFKKTLLIAALSLFFAPLALACDYPKKPELPNGSSASRDDMLTAQKAVKEYMANMETYLGCIDKEEKELIAESEFSDEEKTSREAALNKKYNAAVEEMELLAARFNEQVRDYRAQSE